jgi:hypothetical protein
MVTKVEVMFYIGSTGFDWKIIEGVTVVFCISLEMDGEIEVTL